jgi:hypothetical protein
MLSALTNEQLVVSQLRITHADADHCMAVSGPIVVSIENSEPTVAHLERVFAAVSLAGPKGTSHKVGVLVIIRDNARPPSDAARARIVRLFGEIEGRVGAFAYAMEGEGFAAAAKRSALALILAAKRLAFPMKVFRSAAEALPWMIRTLGGEKATGVTVDRLILAVQRTREEQFERARNPRQ